MSAAPSEARPLSVVRTELRQQIAAVLHDLQFPARRWQVVAEADAWGATGPVRQLIGRLPDGAYPALVVVLDVLVPPPGPGRKKR